MPRKQRFRRNRKSEPAKETQHPEADPASRATAPEDPVPRPPETTRHASNNAEADED